jgi:hypothetical protein
LTVTNPNCHRARSTFIGRFPSGLWLSGGEHHW